MPSGFADPLTPGELDRLFPLERAPIGEGVFELGLALGGTFSAGGYTAGVLDYLAEALDAWTLARETAPDTVPPHRVVISTIAGTSGGGVNGAVFIRAAGWAYPHGASERNPFWKTWAQGVTLEQLLSPLPEPGAPPFASLLNCGSITATAEALCGYTGIKLGHAGVAPRRRSWLANPLRLTVTVTNLTGVPYRIRFTGEGRPSLDLVAHADRLRFALAVDGGVDVVPKTRPDEFALDSYGAKNWEQVAAASLASGAAPILFRARAVTRPLSFWRYRVAVVPGTGSTPAEVVPLTPQWDALAADADALTGGDGVRSALRFTSVDGGIVDNDPIDVARTALFGCGGHKEATGASADRAVIAIAPLSHRAASGPARPPGLLGMIALLVDAVLDQTNFKPEDIALAQNREVYSRFLIAPCGNAGTDRIVVGAAALAGSGLGGLMGYVDARFAEYDFLLGRRNAYVFLRDEFALPETNPIFDHWTETQKWDHTVRVVAGQRHIRLIPLLPSVGGANAPPEPKRTEWPALQELPDALEDGVAARLDWLFGQAMALLPRRWYRFMVSIALRIAWTFFFRRMLTGLTTDAIRKSLRARRLLR